MRFSGLLGKKKPDFVPATGPNGEEEKKFPSLIRRLSRAANKSFPYAVATLILTPFKFVPIINLVAIPAGFLTATATAWNALGGLLDKRPRYGKKEQPEFIPASAAKPVNTLAGIVPTEASVDGNE